MRNLILYTFTLLSMMSCKTYELLNVEKVKIIPGLAQATPYYEYNISIDITKNETTFKEIKIESASLSSTSFSVYDKNEQLYLSNDQAFPVGNYLLQCKFKKNNIKDNNAVTLILEINGKSKEVTSTNVISKEKKLR